MVAKVGDIVECIRDDFIFISFGKKYKIIYIDENYIFSIYDDYGIIRTYLSEYFKTEEEPY